MNYGNFNMYGGSICHNLGGSGGGVYNYGNFNMYGGTIEYNEAERGGGIINRGILQLNGGSISYNAATNGGGIYNDYSIVLTGTVINNNHALNSGGGILEQGATEMTGGVIMSNSATYGGAIYVENAFVISGNISIPSGVDDKNDIYLENPIMIRDKVNAPLGSMAITPARPVEGYWAIYGRTEEITAQNVALFDLQAADYIINSKGFLEYSGSITEYYVGGETASDSNSGISSSSPFLTLTAALNANAGKGCRIILQDDIDVTSSVVIYGRVTIVTDGIPRTITRGGSYTGEIFSIGEGTLILGDNANSDEAGQLILDGKHIADSNFAIVSDMRYSTLYLYEGVTIKNFSDGAIMNEGFVYMHGGDISGCAGSAGIINNTIFYMTGGSIHDNTGTGVVNHGEFYLSGGIITNNGTGGFVNRARLYLSGAPVISAGSTGTYGVYLDRGNIELTGDLGDEVSILLDMSSYVIGTQVLVAEDVAFLQNNNEKFTLIYGDGNYVITDDGTLEYTIQPNTYYVNETLSTNGDGSSINPYNSLEAAVDYIGLGVGNIILKSDVTLHKPIAIYGTISLRSDGEIHTIRRGSDFISLGDAGEDTDFYYNDEAMFIVVGSLTLGNTANNGNDNNLTLILDGAEAGSLEDSPLILNMNVLNVYSGVALQNNGSEDHYAGAVYNDGTFKLFGGVIRNNKSSSHAGVYNIGTFMMYGGSITGNVGRTGGVYTESAYFEMSGGTISDNTGQSAGIFIEEGHFLMTGGSITENTATSEGLDGVAGVSVHRGVFSMSGGSIAGNEGIMSGVFLIGGSRKKSIEKIDIMKVAPYEKYPSEFYMTGGQITGNRGLLTGVCAYYDSYVYMEGGTVGNNDGTAATGIVVQEYNGISLGGDARIVGDDEIILNDVWNKGITINSPLRTESPIRVTWLKLNSEEPSEPVYTIGEQIIKSGPSYAFTYMDAEKFVLPDATYGINPEGKVGYAIKGGWVTIGDFSSLVYDKTSKTIPISVNNQGTVLRNNVDYIISFSNNTNVGTAQFTLRGIGDYAGKITNTFTIEKAVVKRIITPNPINQIFNATDNMTSEQLLASIGLSEVLVETQGGTLTLPITWSLTNGIFNPKGGTYTYTGVLVGDSNVTTGGLTLTTQIKVIAEKPHGKEIINAGEGNSYIPIELSYIVGQNSLEIAVKPASDKDTSGEKLSIPLSSEDILDQIRIMKSDKVGISVTLIDSLLSGETGDQPELLMTEAFLQLIKESGKEVSVTVYDGEGRERYSWNFTSEVLEKSEQKLKEVNLFLKVASPNSDDELLSLLKESKADIDNSLVINFGHDGVLPGQATVRIYVGDQPGMTEGSKVYLYHYNKLSEKLETLPFSSGYVVDKEGYITIDILHCSDYVVLPKEADRSVITALKDQITINASKPEIYLGGTKDGTAEIIINLPPTLELVASLEEETRSSAIGGVTVAYRSGNKKIATVDEQGIITAKGTGTVTIYSTVTLYSGKSKTFKTNVTVTKPYIRFTANTDKMVIGDTFTFQVEAFGLEVEDIVWSTTAKSVVTIHKSSGKAKAVSKGTDYVVVTIQDVVKKLKVIVQ
jgi:predicted outer membrane repeat protein